MKKLIFVISFIILSGFLFGFSTPDAKAAVCTNYNDHIYCRGFKSTDPEGSSCEAACSERNYTCPVGDNMFRSVSDIATVARTLGLLGSTEEYSAHPNRYYYRTPYVRKKLSTGAKAIYFNSNWIQDCPLAPITSATYERINICRCELPPTYTLTVNIVSPTLDENKVKTSIGSGGKCHSFTKDYEAGKTATLIAEPGPAKPIGSEFVGWSGDCSGTETTCKIDMNSNKTVYATFDTQAPECTTYNGYTYCRSFKSIDPKGSSCQVACSERGLICPSGESNLGSRNATFAVGKALGLLSHEDWCMQSSDVDVTYVQQGQVSCSRSANYAREQDCAYAHDPINPFDQYGIQYVSICRCQAVLTSEIQGTGFGWVYINPPGFSYTSNTTHTYDGNPTVTLIATAAAGSVFAGWSGGACSGTGSCTLTMDSNKSVTATFDKAVIGDECTDYNGYTYCRGFKSTDPQGSSSCNTACSERGYTCPSGNNKFWSSTQLVEVACLLGLLGYGEPYNLYSSSYYRTSYVRKTISTGAKTIFSNSNWDQSCTYTPASGASYERVNICRCEKALAVHTLSVTKDGDGSGTVTSNPAIDCGTICSYPFDRGKSVTLTATPAAGSVFAGWSGACSGTGSCTISMTSDKSVTATFDSRVTYNLSVNSSPVTGINISSATGHGSTANYTRTNIESGTSVSLTAPATYSSYAFSNWSGCDSVSDTTCNLTMNSNRTVTANYVLLTHILTVGKSGTGSGTITSNPTGINCGGTCSYSSYSFDSGTSVTLTATPAAGSVFAGWSGACSGTGSCTISMTSDKSVTAYFNITIPPPPPPPPPEECTTYNGYTYCRGFKSTDPQGSSCNTACSERGYTCPVGDNMFRSLLQIADVAVKLGLLNPEESYSSGAGTGYYSPYIRNTLATGLKAIFYDPNWNQNCTYAPPSDSGYERVKICRCEGTPPPPPPPEEMLVPGYNFYVKTSDTGTGNWSSAKSSCEALGSGWSLPTMDQLRILYQKKDEIGGFKDQAYWSLESGRYIHFSNGFEGSINPRMTFPAFRCVKEAGITGLDYLEDQLTSLSNVLSKLIEQIGDLIGR